MTLTEEMANAFQLIESTTDCLYVTGKAGTGKTTFLKYVVENTHKNVVVAASTGIAAVNACGTTLHSLFNIPLGVQNPNSTLQGKFVASKIEMFVKLDTLIIDEISMVRPDTIDAVDRKLRLYRMNDEPFGGIQVVMFGDPYQLPPVVKKEEKDILFQLYRGAHFFYAHAFLKRGFKVVELTNVFRQQDERFVEILNHIRNYKLTSLDIEDLDTLRDRRESLNFNNKRIHICAYKKDAQKINMDMLGAPTHTFVAKFNGDFPVTSAICEETLLLRPGARVMALTNDPGHRYYNGSMGEVAKITGNSIDIMFDNSGMVSITPFTWKAKEYKIENGKIKTIDKGSCTQFPLALAWAITIHKSQGLTFDNVSIHANNIFASGQLYVALSRCRTMEGIVFESFINNRHIIPDKELMAFDKAVKEHKGIYDKTTYRSMKLK